MVVLGENVTFGQRKVLVGDKLILSAAAGDRVWKSVLNKLAGDQEDALNREFKDRRALPFQPLRMAVAAADVPFAVDMRNGFNFYHFLTESLPQLALIAEIDSPAPIIMHMPVLSHLKGFVTAFVRDLFPDIADRVSFTDEPRRYAQVRFVYNNRHSLYQIRDPQADRTLALLDPNDPWRDLGSDRDSRKFLLKSTYDTGMKALRQRVLDLVRKSGLTGGHAGSGWDVTCRAVSSRPGRTRERISCWPN